MGVLLTILFKFKYVGINVLEFWNKILVSTQHYETTIKTYKFIVVYKWKQEKYIILAI